MHTAPFSILAGYCMYWVITCTCTCIYMYDKVCILYWYALCAGWLHTSNADCCSWSRHQQEHGSYEPPHSTLQSQHMLWTGRDPTQSWSIAQYPYCVPWVYHEYSMHILLSLVSRMDRQHWCWLLAVAVVSWSTSFWRLERMSTSKIMWVNVINFTRVKYV